MDCLNNCLWKWMKSVICHFKILRPCHCQYLHHILHRQICTWTFILMFSYQQKKILLIHNHHHFTMNQINVFPTMYGDDYAWCLQNIALSKNIRQIMLHICIRKRRKSVLNQSIRHQSMHSWIIFLILFLASISCDKRSF